MKTKKKKPRFNEPTETKWFAKAVRDKKATHGYSCVVKGDKFISLDFDGNRFKFNPNIAEILFGRTLEEKMANAHLISAAREMYAALKQIRQELLDGKRVNNHFCITMGLLNSVFKQSEKAIKKAEGK